MLRNGELTYVSLFSSAGVGCYGFLQEHFHCILTNELPEKKIKRSKAATNNFTTLKDTVSQFY